MQLWGGGETEARVLGPSVTNVYLYLRQVAWRPRAVREVRYAQMC